MTPEQKRREKKEWKVKVKDIMMLSESLGQNRYELADALNGAGLKTAKGKPWCAATAVSMGLRHGWLARRYQTINKVKKAKVGRPRKSPELSAKSAPKTILRKAPITDSDFIKYAVKSKKLSDTTKVRVVEELI